MYELVMYSNLLWILGNISEQQRQKSLLSCYLHWSGWMADPQIIKIDSIL